MTVMSMYRHQQARCDHFQGIASSIPVNRDSAQHQRHISIPNADMFTKQYVDRELKRTPKKVLTAWSGAFVNSK
jgi:hypothetical protein